MRATYFLARYSPYALIAINLAIVIWVSQSTAVHWGKRRKADTVAYTYVGDDYPLDYPMGSLDPVAMTLHESVRFSLNLTDSVADKEWESLATYPLGLGRTRLGPDHRVFVLTFYHQLHCLWKFHAALVSRDDPAASPHHVQHCLNYLRQLFLCEAADTLEAGDFMKRGFEQDRIGDTLVCRDWEKVYNVLDEAHAQWVDWSLRWN